MSLSKRHLTIRFQLLDGSFDDSGNDSFEISGLRASATIEKTGSAMSTLELVAYGLPLTVMNKLTILGKPQVSGRNNKVSVLAGSDATGLATVFEGTIQEAWVNGESAPDVAFNCSAFAGIDAAMKPIAPTSYKGPISAALAVSALAQENGYAFENSGVTAVVNSPYYPGTMLAQLQQMAQEGDFNFILEDYGTSSGGQSTGPTVAIWPKDGVRQGEVPLLAVDTGMDGYPTRTQAGVSIRTLFNPSIVFGGSVQVESILTPANGTWTPYMVRHELESETPGGKWFTTIDCTLFGQPLPDTAP